MAVPLAGMVPNFRTYAYQSIFCSNRFIKEVFMLPIMHH